MERCIFKKLYRIAQLLIGIQSENYDAAHDLMIYCDFLLVLHCYGTPITNNIKQCVNDKTDHRQQKSLLVVSWWSIFEIHIF